MKILTMKHLILSLMTAVAMTATVTTSAASLAEHADSAYNKEDYHTAIDLYSRAIDTDGVSADIYYNLGNAFFRNGQAGMAVVNYERALKLEPAHADARHNLAFVRSRIQDLPEDDSSFLVNLHHGIRNLASANAWAWIALSLFIALLACVALYIFTRNVPLRKTGFFGGISLLFIFIYTLVLARGSASDSSSHETAVVIVPTTHLSSTPRAMRGAGDKVVPIHEGTKVEITDSVATPDDPQSPQWYKVKINNSSSAWLRAIDVERI